MRNKPLAYYIATQENGAEVTVQRWEEHPALLPTHLEVRRVSTAAGDVELRIPFTMSRNLTQMGKVFREVERLHPKPDDLERIDQMTSEEQLNVALEMALEYIELAEGGRGHNARSRYLARCLRHIQQINE